MAARGDGVEGDERVWVVVVGRGEPGWRLSVEGEFGCELELGAAMVAAGRLCCASRELCVGKRTRGKGGRSGMLWFNKGGRAALAGAGQGLAAARAALGRTRPSPSVACAGGAARAACALEWDGDGAAQRGSSEAAAGAARQQHGSGAAVRACALGEQGERGRERER